MGPVMKMAALLLSALLLTACAPSFPAPGAAVTVPHLTETTLIARDGHALPLRRWLPQADAPPKAVVLALHGFNDYSNAFAEVGDWLTDLGVAVYAYDQRGFGANPDAGRWAGAEQMAQDARDGLAALHARWPDTRLILMGESMGGAVAVTAMTGGKALPVDGVILSAPGVLGRKALPWSARAALAVMGRVAPGMTMGGRGLNLWPSDNHPMLAALAQDPLVLKGARVEALYGATDLMDLALDRLPSLRGPVLWLYGAHDEIVPAEATLTAARTLDAAEGQRFVLYPDGWHMLTRDRAAEVVLRDIGHWVLDPGEALPSGLQVDPTDPGLFQRFRPEEPRSFWPFGRKTEH